MIQRVHDFQIKVFWYRLRDEHHIRWTLVSIIEKLDSISCCISNDDSEQFRSIFLADSLLFWWHNHLNAFFLILFHCHILPYFFHCLREKSKVNWSNSNCFCWSYQNSFQLLSDSFSVNALSKKNQLKIQYANWFRFFPPARWQLWHRCNRFTEEHRLLVGKKVRH